MSLTTTDTRVSPVIDSRELVQFLLQIELIVQSLIMY